ncbi:MATE family efflux transporter [Subdoligranulum sp. DSM 109015]|uniref:Probable multidrug resistance protein NorM n=1 Tax=Gemmiger gallinarum TaxID=2779354 RepID=A0ABR9R5X2_9FIRM|nr:MATE family efflux transporter [Gemmiger gallinarum]MBE5038552.1 MATE family efflux transporter [Gemmiger gallinarum]
MDQVFMKQRPVLPLVISMALPMTLSMLVSSLYNIVDSYFVARISEDAMTALSLVYPVQNLVTAITVGFAIGVNAVIAFLTGAGKQDQASCAASLGMWLNILHGVLLTAGCLLAMPGFLSLFTDSHTVLSLGLRYSNIVFWFCVPIAAGMAFEKIFQAVGKMTVSMICMLIGCAANIILDPLLIFGIGPFPALGIEGAAIATGLGQCLTLAAYLVFYAAGSLPLRIRLRGLTSVGFLARRMYLVGVPATLSLALASLLITALNGILSAFSQTYVLILGAYYKLQSFLYLTANGVVQGIRPLMGYNYGAGEYARVRRIFRTSLLLIAAVMLLGTLLCLVAPGALISLFTDNAETIRLGAGALRIISLGFVVSSLSVTASGALEGLGKGMESLVISLCRYTVLILPLAWVFSRFWGADGVWHAFWVTEVLTAALSWFIYRRATAFAR